MNQDSLGIPGFEYLKMGEMEIWVKPLKDNEVAVCFLNRGTDTQNIAFKWEEHFIKDDFVHKQYKFDQTDYQVREVWAKKNMGTTKKSYVSEIASHDVRLLKLKHAR